MDRRNALVIGAEVLTLVERCKNAFPSAYEYITSGLGITDEEIMEAHELLQKEAMKEKLRAMST